MKLKTWHWSILILLLALSVVAEFTGHHGGGHAQPGHETPAVQDSHDTHDTQAAHDTQVDTHEAKPAEHQEVKHEEKSEEHGSNFWTKIPMFWILFGGVGCFVIIIFAKKLLGLIVYKKEDYYNE